MAQWNKTCTHAARHRGAPELIDDIVAGGESEAPMPALCPSAFTLMAFDPSPARSL